MLTLGEESYFVRFRGRISGPIAPTELRKMAERGALSRFHELSLDQQAWSPAGGFHGLFPGEGIAGAPVPIRGMESTVPIAPAARPGVAPAEPRYFYSRGAATIGPVNAQTLHGQIARGTLHATDPVWQEGSRTTVMASDLPALAGVFATVGRAQNKRGSRMLLVVAIFAAVAAITAVVLFLVMEG